MGTINVLWMNNGDESVLSFVNDSFLCNLNITTCCNMKECRSLLSGYSHVGWDVVLLNLNPRMQDEIPKSFNLRKAYLQVVKLTDAPIFVVSASGNVDKLDKSNAVTLSGGKFFELQKSSSLLYENIKREVEDSEDYRIRIKYEKILDFYKGIDDDSTDSLLIGLLKKLHKSDFFKDLLVPSNVRLILDSVMTYLTNIGILKETPFKGSNLRECSIELGKKGWIVPYHIQRCFHSCVDIANNGNHKIPEESDNEYQRRISNPLFVQKQISTCKAPYLNIAVVYDLLNILYWCATLKEK